MTPKFRAWDKKNKSMHEVELIDFSDNIGYLSIENGRGDWYSFEVDTILMQSTGLKDKNGVEIFDGDIVAVENHPFQRKEDSGAGIEIEGNYVVGWNQHDLTWCAGDLLLARLKPYVRVIGNMYENSEILKQ
ncbi:YopX family protein [Enterococcus mundtii]|uniref:YopX family protein n=1 Tax=Enterococcus mundtii TaxID=53346 RepID=UPI0010BF2768|nr:YopX family protein [Enterococcus mundtii]NBA63512.1 hypothetical protein [Enterococcus mundtii]QCJ57232.1 hypothetical protein DDJ96_11685 [Enterococcus mundtii]